MAVEKNPFPIFEFDDQKSAVIENYHDQPDIKLPEKCVFAFLGGEMIDAYAKLTDAKILGEFSTITKDYPIYQMIYEDEPMVFVAAPLGSSAAAQFLDWLIGHGVNKVISAGSCGVLRPILENELLIPTAALRAEGTSYHYIRPSRWIMLNPYAIEAIETTLCKHRISYERVKTWTTDGFYRETKEMVKYRLAEGCDCVEMECAALAAVAEFRSIIFGQLLYSADSLANLELYDERDWGKGAKQPALRLAIEALSNL